jgi:hypothetical protein
MFYVLRRDSPVSVLKVGALRADSSLQQIGKILPVMNTRTIIELAYLSVWQNTADITDRFILQMKRVVVFVIRNKHTILHRKTDIRPSSAAYLGVLYPFYSSEQRIAC